MCLIGNTIWLCTKHMEIKHHFPARRMSHTIFRVEASTCGILESYSGDGYSKLHFVQRNQDSCVVMRDISVI